MQTSIKVTCPGCGTKELTPPDMTVVCFTQGGGDYYEFTCHDCRFVVQKAADDHVVGLLRSGGVECKVVERPAEALEEHSGPAISYDELLDFHLALRHVDYPTEIISR